MEQYENLMKLFRNECQYAGAMKQIINEVIIDLVDNQSIDPVIEAILTRLKFRLDTLKKSYP